MTKRAQLADGTVLEFPDSTPDEIIDRTVKAHVGAPANDSRTAGVSLGALKPVDNLASWASRIPVVGPAVDELGQALGMPSAAQAVANNDAARAANTRTGYQTLGNILGTLPTAYIPGGLAAQGAASGALLSDAKTPGQLATDSIVGGITSLLGGKALDAAGGAIAPSLSRGVRQLNEAGIMMTPGQILSGSKSAVGRGLSKMEEAATSVPFLGDMINMAREQGNETFNKALANRALGNVGKKLPGRVGAGDDMVNYVSRALGNSYDDLVPKLSATFDQPFASDLTNAKNLTDTLPDAYQQKFQNILSDVLKNRAAGKGVVGQNLKDAESRLTYWIGKYAKSSNGDDQVLGDALKATRQALRGSVSRSNPQYAQELGAINKGWAQLVPMRKASEASPDGVFSPARMFQESRKTGFKDPLVRKAAARLKNTTPDSGTARRAAATLATTAGGSGALAALFNPWLAVPGALATLYTKPGMKVVNKAVFAERGPVAKAVGGAVRSAGRAASAIFPGLTPYLLPHSGN